MSTREVPEHIAELANAIALIADRLAAGDFAGNMSARTALLLNNAQTLHAWTQMAEAEE